MKIKLITLFLSLIIFNGIHAQTDDECKYFQVLSYIRSNSAFNSQLKEYLDLNKRAKKAKFVEVTVTPWIEFIEFSQFKNKVNVDSVGINKDTLSNEGLYFQAYNFEPYKSAFLEKIFSPDEDSGIYLTFSKVIGRTLLIEILNSHNPPHRIRRIGSGVKILFIFDQLGMISTVLFTKVYYN